MNDVRREMLLNEYREVCNNFRMLTDIRFRMLSFLPAISGLFAAGVAIKGNLLGVWTFVLALLGLAATIGLAIYNARNDQLYNELVGRAAEIERTLGLQDGSFANRPRAWLSLWIAPICLKEKDEGAAKQTSPSSDGDIKRTPPLRIALPLVPGA